MALDGGYAELRCANSLNNNGETNTRKIVVMTAEQKRREEKVLRLKHTSFLGKNR